MSKRFGLLVPLLAASLGLWAASAAPVAAAAGTPARAVTMVRPLQTQQARFGGFRARPSFGSRYRAPRYGYRRYRPFHGFGGSILRALGIAYLLHLAFGWGGGGSPFGLLLLAALVVWLFTRRRRVRVY